MSDLRPRAIVTGGAGFIGSHLVSRLLSDGWSVTVVDDGSTGDLGRLPSNCAVHASDFATLTADDWAGILRPGSVVFHLAAKKLNTPGVTGDELLHSNITGTLNLATAAKSVGVRAFVFASSLYVYDHRNRGLTNELLMPCPGTLYGTSKLAGEGILRSVLEGTNVAWGVARLYFVYGPRQFPGSGYKSVIVANFERLASGQPPIVRGDGSQKLDYVYVDDVVEALLLIAGSQNSGEVFNISSGNALSIAHLTSIMAGLSGASMPKWQFAPPDWTHGLSRAGDSRKVRKELGWNPTVGLDEGLRRTWLDLTQGTLGDIV